jgi:hypothetical protein
MTLPWFWVAQFLIGLPLLYADLKWKRVPLFLVLLFVGLLVGMSALCHGVFVFLKVMFAGIGVIFIQKKFFGKIGRADLGLISSIFVYLPPQKFPFFLVICGILGLMIAFIWRTRYHEKLFPFIPAILLAFWLQLFLEGRV